MPEFICPHCHAVYREKQSLCNADGSLLIEVPVLADLSGEVLKQKYKLDEALGHGGFGSVYKATHLVLGRPVAVKVLRAEFRSDSNMVARFFNEARVVTRLTNPHTINTFDLDQTDDGLLFMVMDYIQGDTLRKLAKAEGEPPGRLPWRRTCRLLIQVCDSLEEAHREGVVHRDLKPDNVMVSNRGGEPDFVTVLDFGIAKVLEGADMASLTTAGTILGSPAYMSPEQVRSSKITALSDIYSLGAVAFHALSGTLPVTARQTAAILQEKIHSKPVPITRKTPDVTVPLELDELLVRMLALEPEDRPQTAAEVKDRLNSMLQRYQGVPDDKKSYQAVFNAPPAAASGTEAGTRGYDGMPLEGAAPDFALDETLASRVHEEMTEDDDAEVDTGAPRPDTPPRQETPRAPEDPFVLPKAPMNRRLIISVSAITLALALVAGALVMGVQFGGKKGGASDADGAGAPAVKEEPAPEGKATPETEAQPAAKPEPVAHEKKAAPVTKKEPVEEKQPEDHRTPTAMDGPAPEKQPEDHKAPTAMEGPAPEEQKQPEDHKAPTAMEGPEPAEKKRQPVEKLPALPIHEGDEPEEEKKEAEEKKEPVEEKKEPVEEKKEPVEEKKEPVEEKKEPAEEGKAEEEAAARKKAEEEAARKKAEEEAARKKAEEEAARKKAEEEAVRKAEEERKKSEEEMNNMLDNMGSSGSGSSDPSDDMFKEMEGGPNW